VETKVKNAILTRFCRTGCNLMNNLARCCWVRFLTKTCHGIILNLMIFPSSVYSTVCAIFDSLTYLNESCILKYQDNFNLLCNLCQCHLLNLLASVRLFTSDTKWLVPPEHATGSQMFSFQPSKVNSYKTTLHNLN